MSSSIVPVDVSSSARGVPPPVGAEEGEDVDAAAAGDDVEGAAAHRSFARSNIVHSAASPASSPAASSASCSRSLHQSTSDAGSNVAPPGSSVVPASIRAASASCVDSAPSLNSAWIQTHSAATRSAGSRAARRAADAAADASANDADTRSRSASSIVAVIGETRARPPAPRARWSGDDRAAPARRGRRGS
eukprot:31408-Pelagococcus_subviridis.AAC.3